MKPLKSLLCSISPFIFGCGFSANAGNKTAFDFTFTSIDGKPMPLSQYRGKELLIVNTASECGFTKQYSALEEVWRKYKGQGLVVIGVPSNDFGGQEPGHEGQIKKFCETHFSIDFPMTGKTPVKGDGAHPFYKWARQTLGIIATPKWNFHKYLIAPDGHIADWFLSSTAPDSASLERSITANLPGK